ncbi:MAG: hypothetical protein LWW86_01855 [Micrococcales bacterium]|nr:hypothetical protein [Micrococcales bacterium]
MQLSGWLASSIVPIVLLVIYTTGLLVAMGHPDRAPWRTLALSGFGLLILTGLSHLALNAWLFSGGYRQAGRAMWSLASITSGILSAVGVALVVGAVLTGRPRAGASASGGPQQPYPPQGGYAAPPQ